MSMEFQEHPLVELQASAKCHVWSVVTLHSAGVKVLTTPDVEIKAQLTYQFAYAWREGIITEVDDTAVVASGVQSWRDLPVKPVRPVVDNDKAQWGNKKSSVLNTIHGIAHAESYAIELFWDVIARFSHYQLPIEFYDEMVSIAGQEASHFLAWSVRLTELECPYGSLPTHDGLWRDAEKTSHSLLARLAIINMLHEARGLDVFPLTLKKFRNNRDEESIRILEKNFGEEIFHVATGLKWFKFLCSEKSKYNHKAETEFNTDVATSIETFHSIVHKFHTGALKKDTVNIVAREQAGMTNAWIDDLYT